MRNWMKCVVWWVGLCLLSLSGWSQEGLSPFDKRIHAKLSELRVEQASEADPLQLSGALVRNGDSLAVILKVNLAPGWHIYQRVPENMPYINTECILKAPEKVSKEGHWSHSSPKPSLSESGVWIHEDEAWFVYKTTVKGPVKEGVRAGIYYQTCDLRQCLPPREKLIQLH